eukprot:CAMPEP_0197248902 /NCGR_PEP_ID=MMETSP1429-20130617/43707_1 /TAXON_ID=49237 /ORGANISM="Chaetoceros  sp., Strain UNC1202" /LENGTH=45 /DNA_ID= /DNA_START= /DNA_END= /DNA_ORIENTATION=
MSYTEDECKLGPFFMTGIVIRFAVIPLWNMMTWKKASGPGAVIAA